MHSRMCTNACVKHTKSLRPQSAFPRCKICVRTGNVVDRVEIHFSDGAFIGSGGGGGEWRLPVTLEIGEYIIGFGGRKGGVLGDSLGAIYFTTNLGRAHNFAGRFNGGRAFHKLIEPGHELISFSASSPPGRTWLTSTIGYNTVSSSWTSPMAKLLLAHPNRAIFEPGITRPFFHRARSWMGTTSTSSSAPGRKPRRARSSCQIAPASPSTQQRRAFEGVVEVFFKDRRHGNNDWRWQTWLKTDWNGADPPQLFWPGNAHEEMGYSPFMYGELVDNEDDDEDEEEEEDDGEETPSQQRATRSRQR